jgi:N-dimethylarginine dimethylaminohydrolase
MVEHIRSFLLKHPKEAFISQENIRSQWKELNYMACPDYEKAIEEYDNFTEYLQTLTSDIFYLPQNDKTGLDSIYVRDALIITGKGAILCSMGKKARRGEPSAAGEFLQELNIPILGSITGEGRLEGGDVVWLDERAIAVGRGYRTNDEGIRQLKVVPLPHWKGPEDVMHLMSLISPVDYGLAVVYSNLLPVPFLEQLLKRGVKLLDVPVDEFETMACNILALAPGKCIMISGNPQTKRMLEHEGVEVWEYAGEEISRKGAGGPTCLTQPLLREATRQ